MAIGGHWNRQAASGKAAEPLPLRSSCARGEGRAAAALKAAHSAGVPTNYHSPPPGRAGQRAAAPLPRLSVSACPQSGLCVPGVCLVRPPHQHGPLSPLSTANSPSSLFLPYFNFTRRNKASLRSLAPSPFFPPSLPPSSVVGAKNLDRACLAGISQEGRTGGREALSRPPSLKPLHPSLHPLFFPCSILFLSHSLFSYSLPLQPRPPHSSFSVPCPNIERGEREEEEEEEEQ